MFINEFDVFVGKHQAIPSLDQSTEQLHLMVECFLLVKAESVRFVAAEGFDQLDCFWMEDSERGYCHRPEADPSLRNSAPTALSFLSWATLTG